MGGMMLQWEYVMRRRADRERKVRGAERWGGDYECRMHSERADEPTNE